MRVSPPMPHSTIKMDRQRLRELAEKSQNPQRPLQAHRAMSLPAGTPQC